MAGYRRSPLVTWDCCIWSGTWEDQSPCMMRLVATTPLRVCTHTGAWGRSLFHGSQLPGGGGGGWQTSPHPVLGGVQTGMGLPR